MEESAPEFFSSSGYWGSFSGTAAGQSDVDPVKTSDSSVKGEHAPSNESHKVSDSIAQADVLLAVQVGFSPIQTLQSNKHRPWPPSTSCAVVIALLFFCTAVTLKQVSQESEGSRQGEVVKEEPYTLPPLRSIEKIRTDLKASRGMLGPSSQDKGRDSLARAASSFHTATPATIRLHM
jgi:hypothetical protein